MEIKQNPLQQYAEKIGAQRKLIRHPGIKMMMDKLEDNWKLAENATFFLNQAINEKLPVTPVVRSLTGSFFKDDQLEKLLEPLNASAKINEITELTEKIEIEEDKEKLVKLEKRLKKIKAKSYKHMEAYDVSFKFGYMLHYILVKMNKGVMVSEKESEIIFDRAKLFDAYLKETSDKPEEPRIPAKRFIPTDHEWINELLTYAPEAEAVVPESCLQTTMPDPWTEFDHPLLGAMVNKCHRRLRRKINKMIKSGDLKKFLSVVNNLQETPLTPNSSVLGTCEDLINEIYVCKYVDHETGEIIPIDVNEFNHKNYSKDDLYYINGETCSLETFNGKIIQIQGTLSEASKYEGYTVYAPVKPSFVGRLSYTPSYFQPGGTDLGKGNILYGGDPKPLEEKGWKALQICTIDMFGEDKLSKAKKFELFDEMMDEIYEIGRNTGRTNKSWLKWSKPVQGLAHCVEVYNALMHEGGGKEFEYPTRLFVGQDAGMSGAMQMGIATQDYVTMFRTNLIAHMERQDGYKDCGRVVMRMINEMLYEIDDSESAGRVEIPLGATLSEQMDIFVSENKTLRVEALLQFKELFQDEKILREWMKRQVMIIAYSAKETCLAATLWEDHQAGNDFLTPPGCEILAEIIYKAYEEVLPGCFQVMLGLQKLSDTLHKLGKQVEIESVWDNFPMIFDYGERDSADVRVTYNGKKVEFSVQYNTGKLDKEASKRAIAPVCIHNGDAVTLRQAVNKFSVEGECPIIVNHDDFRCLPSDYDKLSEVLREVTYDMALPEYNILRNIEDHYKDIKINRRGREEKIKKSGKDIGGKYYKYFDVKDEDGKVIYDRLDLNYIGIEMHDLHPQFSPQDNEYCY